LWLREDEIDQQQYWFTVSFTDRCDRRRIGVSSANSLVESKHMHREAGLQRLQPPTSAAHPVRKSRAIDIDPVPGEDLALPVKRKVIAVLGDQT